MFPAAGSALFVLVMVIAPGKILAGAVLLVLLGAIVYSGMQVVAAQRYLSVQPPALNSVIPISILKPLSGMDLGLESNLRTFFEQDYPSFEILFAVRNEADPAAQVVSRSAKRISRRFPRGW